MYRLITIISILACFVPLVILIIKKLWHEKIYVSIATYWLLCGLINVTTLFNINISPEVNKYITLTADYTDLPIVLFIFYLASEGVIKNILKITIVCSIVFEICITFIKGFNYDSVTIILGVSLFVIIVFGIIGIVNYLSKIQHTPKENVMVLIYSSFLFFYGTFIIVYIFSYLSNKSGDRDTYLLYYLELLLASIPAIYGLLRFAGLKVNMQESRHKVEGF